MDSEVDKASLVTCACSWETRQSISSRVSEFQQRKTKNRKKVVQEATVNLTLKALSRRKDTPTLATLLPPANTTISVMSIINEAKEQKARTVDFSSIPLDVDELIYLCEGMSVLPTVQCINLESLATPRSLSKHVHKMLMRLASSCTHLTELVLSESCELTGPQEDEINNLLIRNADRTEERHRKREERKERRLEALRRKIPDDVMDFFYWENSERVAIMQLREKERQSLSLYVEREHTKLLLKMLREKNHKEQFEARSRLEAVEANQRWEVAADEDDEWQMLELQQMTSLETSARATLMFNLKKMLEAFQIMKVEDFIRAKDNMKRRVQAQRQQRLAIIHENRRGLVALRAEVKSFWFVLHVWFNSMKLKAQRLEEERRERAEFEEIRKRDEEMRLRQIEAQKKQLEELENLKRNMSDKERREALEQEEQLGRSELDAEYDKDARVLRETFHAIADLNRVESTRLSKLELITETIADLFPRLRASLNVRAAAPCFYMKGDPTIIFKDLQLVFSEDDIERCRTITDRCVADYQAILPKYRAAAEMIEFRRSQLERMKLDNQPHFTNDMPDPPSIDMIMKETQRVQPNSKLKVTIKSEVGNELKCVLPPRILEWASVDVSGPVANITIVKPVPCEYLPEAINCVVFTSRKAVADTEMIPIALDGNLVFGVPDTDLNIVKYPKRNFISNISMLIGKQTFKATSRNVTFDEYQPVKEALLFDAPSVGDPLMRTDQSINIRSPYNSLQLSVEEGCEKTDLFTFVPSGNCSFFPDDQSFKVSDEVVARVTSGTIYAPHQATQAVSNDIVEWTSKATIQFTTECLVENIASLVKRLALVSRNPAVTEGKRVVHATLIDDTGAAQTSKAEIKFERTRAKTVLQLASNKKSFVNCVDDLAEYDGSYLHPYTFVFSNCLLTNADTDKFVGGSVVIKCQGGDSKDFLGIATTQVQDAIRNQFDFPAPNPESRASVDNDGIITFGGSVIGTMKSGTVFYPPALGTQAIRFAPPSAAARPNSGCSSMTINLSDSGSCSIRGVQALLHAVAFYTTSDDDMRNVSVEIRVGPSLGKVNENNIVVIPFEVPTMPKTIPITATATLQMRVSNPILASKIKTFSYKERGGLVRPPLVEMTGAVTDWQNAVFTVEVFPPQENDLFTLHGHDIHMAPMGRHATMPNLHADDFSARRLSTGASRRMSAQGSIAPMGSIRRTSSGLGRTSSQLGRTSSNLNSATATPSATPSALTPHALSGSATFGKRNPGSPAQSPRSRRRSSAVQIADVDQVQSSSVEQPPNASSSTEQAHLPLEKRNSQDVDSRRSSGLNESSEKRNSTTNSTGPGWIEVLDTVKVEEQSESGSISPRSPSDAPFLVVDHNDDPGESLTNIVRLQSMVTNSLSNMLDHRKLYDNVVNQHQARDQRELQKKISNGFDHRLQFDAAKGSSTMRLTLKDGSHLGSMIVIPGKTIFKLGNASRRDLGMVIRSLSFTNHGDFMRSSRRTIRYTITDNYSSFTQLVIPTTFEGTENPPKLSLLSNQIFHRLGASFLAFSVGSLCIMPEGRAILRNIDPVVDDLAIMIKGDAETLMEGDRLGLLSEDQQMLQHDRATAEAQQLGPKYEKSLRADVPDDFTISTVEEANDRFNVVDDNGEDIAKIKMSGNDMTIKFVKGTDLHVASHVLNCVSFTPASVAGHRKFTVTSAIEDAKPVNTTITVSVLSDFAGLVSPRRGRMKETAREVTIRQEPGSVFSLNGKINVKQDLGTLTLVNITVAESIPSESFAKIEFEKSNTIRVRKEHLFIRGSNCGSVFLSRRQLRLEPTTLLTTFALQDLLNAIVVTISEHSLGTHVVTVAIHDDVDLPTTIRFVLKNKRADETPSRSYDETPMDADLASVRELATTAAPLEVDTAPPSLAESASATPQLNDEPASEVATPPEPAVE